MGLSGYSAIRTILGVDLLTAMGGEAKVLKDFEEGLVPDSPLHQALQAYDREHQMEFDSSLVDCDDKEAWASFCAKTIKELDPWAKASILYDSKGFPKDLLHRDHDTCSSYHPYVIGKECPCVQDSLALPTLSDLETLSKDLSFLVLPDPSVFRQVRLYILRGDCACCT